MIQYEDFSLRFEPKTGEVYPVSVASPAGEARSSFRLPFEPSRAGALLSGIGAVVRGGSQTASQEQPLPGGRPLPQEIGGQLFNALFSGPARSLFYHSLGLLGGGQQRGMRIKLHLDPSDPSLAQLASLPWEFLYLDESREFLNLSAYTPVVRYLDIQRPYHPPALQPPLRVLVVISAPSDYPPLDLARERSLIEGSWARQPNVQVDFLERADSQALQERLSSQDVHVLHFMGHGAFDRHTGRGVLLMTDENGAGRPLDGETLGILLRDERSLRLVFLNACETANLTNASGRDPFAGVAAALVMAGVPAVVAMQFPITDRAAIAFSSQFYPRLADGYPVDSAMAEGRKAVVRSDPGTLEWGTPVLFMRTPDGRLFDAPLPPAERGAAAFPEPAEAGPPAGARAAGRAPAATTVVATPTGAPAKARRPTSLYAAALVLLIILAVVVVVAIQWIRGGLPGASANPTETRQPISSAPAEVVTQVGEVTQAGEVTPFETPQPDSTPAPVQPGAALSEDFESGLALGKWVTGSSLRVVKKGEDNQALEISGGEDMQVFYRPAWEWTGREGGGIAFQADIMVDSAERFTSSVQILAQVQSTQSDQSCQAYVGELGAGWARLSERIPLGAGCGSWSDENLAPNALFELRQGEWHQLRLEIQGDELRFLIDGRLATAAVDLKGLYSQGGVGFSFYRTSNAYIDNLRIEQLAAGPLFSPDSAGWTAAFYYPFPDGTWSPGEHNYNLTLTCPSHPELRGSGGGSFSVTEAAQLYEYQYLLLLSGGPHDDLVGGNPVESLNPSQETRAAMVRANLTYAAAREALQDCLGSVAWDGGSEQPLQPWLLFQP